jgi:hypothetical protein
MDTVTELQLITALSNGGAFALLSYVVYWVMRENSKREERLMAVIEKYSRSIEELSDRVKDVGKSLDLIERRIPSNMGGRRQYDRRLEEGVSVD